MADIIDFPRSIAPRVLSLHLVNQTRSMTQSLSGVDQGQASLAAHWSYNLEFPTLSKKEARAWRAIIAKLQGRLNNLRIPIYDKKLQPDIIEYLSAHSDGTATDDGGLYATNDVEGVTITGSKGLKAIDVDLSGYPELDLAGAYFGIEDDCYICKSDDRDGDSGTIQFEPSLRRDYTDAIFRMRPVLVCKMTDNGGGRLSLERGIKAEPTLELREALEPSAT